MRKPWDTSEPWNDVVYEIESGIQEITTKTPFAQIESYVDAITHFGVMERIFFLQIHALHESYAALIPTETGHHELRVDIPAKQLFIPHVPVQSSTVNFKG